MPYSSSNSLIFYPAYCLSFSPTYSTWARLTAADVHALRERDGYEGQNIYFHLNHPIKWIRLVGVIVALDCHPNRWSMLLDDSCGATIEVLCWYPTHPTPVNNPTTDVPEPAAFKNSEGEGVVDDRTHFGITSTGRTINLRGFDIGAVVKVKGGVGVFRGKKQVTLERISLINNTNDEITSWAETSAFHRDILNSPWAVSDQDLERARKETEGLKRHKRLGEGQRRRKRQRLEDPRMVSSGKDKVQRRNKTDPEARKSALKGPEDEKKTRNRIHKREVKIPSDQQDALNRLEFWLPGQPARSDSFPEAAAIWSDHKNLRSPPGGRYDCLGL